MFHSNYLPVICPDGSIPTICSESCYNATCLLNDQSAYLQCAADVCNNCAISFVEIERNQQFQCQGQLDRIGIDYITLLSTVSKAVR